MPLIQPDGEVRLLNVPFDPGYENTMYFATIEDQTTWMLNHSFRSFTNLSYSRRSKGVIRVEATMGQTYNANYMMFKNTSFENKWFYAFVSNVEYINNLTVEIRYSIDVMQTWLPNIAYQFNDCYIERAHSITDNFGENLIPENIADLDVTWEGTTVESQVFVPSVILCTSLPDGSGQPYGTGKVYNGRIFGGEYYSGLSFRQFRIALPAEMTQLNDLLASLVSANLTESIVAIFMGPFEFYANFGTPDAPLPNDPIIKSIAMTNTLGQYQPRNKKLLTYPYNYIEAYNPDQESRIFKYEYFTNPYDMRFSFWGNKTTRPGIYMYPLDYKGSAALQECLVYNGFPPCAYTYDSFKAWWAQNMGSYLGNTLTAMGAGMSGASVTPAGSPINTGRGTVLEYTPETSITPTTGGTMATGLAVFNSLMRLRDKVFMPPAMGGNGNGDVNYQHNGMIYRFYRKHIRLENAYKLDAYFDMYGYAQKNVGKPNIHARPCYTYVQTIGCSIDGNIPADDERIIESIFDKGIRFWKTSAIFGSFDPDDNYNYYI